MRKLKLALLIAVGTLFTQGSFFAQKSKVHGIEIAIGQYQGTNANGDSTFNYTAKVHLQDTVDVFKVYLKAGTTYQGSDIYNDTYQLYLGQGESNPASITRNGLVLDIDMGAIVPGFYFWEVTTENLNNVQYIPYRKQL